jgi:hypothetical protein
MPRGVRTSAIDRLVAELRKTQQELEGQLAQVNGLLQSLGARGAGQPRGAGKGKRTLSAAGRAAIAKAAKARWAKYRAAKRKRRKARRRERWIRHRRSSGTSVVHPR